MAVESHGTQKRPAEQSVNPDQKVTEVPIKGLRLSNTRPFTLIAGPCVIESAGLLDEVAGYLAHVTTRLGIPWIFKASFDKANRTSASGARGVGLEQGAMMLRDIRTRYGCPVLTDVHEPFQCELLAGAVDILQIPAFLCRQTDLIVAAVKTGAAVNIKKGQFLAPWDMKSVVQKAEQAGGKRVLLCERGVSFGYNTLVVDFRSLPQMKALGWPVIFDATHAVQQPGGLGNASGGQRQFVEPLARAAMAVGVAGLFIETHPNPARALSDGPNMVPLHQMEGFLTQLQQLDRLSKGLAYQPFSKEGTSEDGASKEVAAV